MQEHKMQDHKWLEITFITTSETVEALSEILYNAGCKGVAIEDPKDIFETGAKIGDWDYIDEKLYPENMDEVKVKGYLCESPENNRKIESLKKDFLKLKEYGLDIGAGNVEVREVMEQDWANNWKQYYKPLKIGKHVVIKPSWEEYNEEPQDIVVKLDPGMAFGTGSHETTGMCITLLQDYVKIGSTVFDLGCGSGILSIVASKLGASMVTGIDIDQVAVEVSSENVQLNGVQNITIIQGNLLDKIHGKADVIVANIIADAIIGLCPKISDYLKSDGVFISSGIILEREEDVKQALLSNGFNIIRTERQGEWAAIVSNIGE